jgi:hypothetical protein
MSFLTRPFAEVNSQTMLSLSSLCRRNNTSRRYGLDSLGPLAC